MGIGEAALSHTRAILVLVILAIAAGWAGVRALPPIDRDEARYAQASTQMLESGDYVRINFQDQPRHKKPVGIYWLQTASVTAVSHPDARAIWAYRLPSVLGAVLAVLATYWAGCALVGRTAAFAGAALLSVTVMLGFEATIAKTDAMLVGATTLAMAALAGLYEVRGRWLALVFWVALAVGVLIKGPITPMVAFSALAFLVVIERRVKWLAPLAWWPGPLLAILIVAPWVVAVQNATDGAFLADALGRDLGPKLISGHENHGAPPGTHLALLPISFFPATLFLLPGLAMAVGAFGRGGFVRWDNEHDDDLVYQAAARAAGLRFLMAWALPAWIIFELTPTKLPHYTLPVYPALALMAGAAFAALVTRSVPAITKGVSIVLFAAAGAVLAALLVLLASFLGPDGPAASRELTVLDVADAFRALPQWGLIALAVTGGVLLFIPIILWRAPGAMLAAACVFGLVWQWSALHVVAPRLDAAWVSRAVSAELESLSLHPRRSAAAKPPLAAAGFTEPSLVFYTDTDTVLGEPDRVAQVLTAEVGRAAIVEERVRAAFEAEVARLNATVVLVGDVRGFNYSKGDPVRLHIYRTFAAAGDASGRAPVIEIPRLGEP